MVLSFVRNAERLRVLPAVVGGYAVCADCGDPFAGGDKKYRATRRDEEFCPRCDMSREKLEHETDDRRAADNYYYGEGENDE